MARQRNISIEVTRILAMFMIVLGHAFVHGHATEDIQNNVSGLFTTALETFSVPGTDIFVIISGYFLFRSKISLKRIINTWAQILFYSLSIYIIITISGLNHFSLIGFLKTIFPISFNQYWFMRVYFYLLLCVPFINLLLDTLSQKAHQCLLFLGILLMVIPASIPLISTFNSDAGNGILWFIMLYSTGAYFSKYPPKFKVSRYVLIAFFMFAIAFLSKIFIGYIATQLGFSGLGQSRLSTFDAFPIYFEACSIVCAGIKLSDTFNNHTINPLIQKTVLFFSVSTAGIYMIHEHPLIRNLLWSRLNLSQHTALYAVLISVALFILCAIIDHLTWKQLARYLNRINTDIVDLKFNNCFKK